MIAAEALRAWAESKPGVSRITPRQLGRGERGPFGRYRGGDFGPSPFEIRYGLAEGVEDSFSPVTTISRPLPDDCAALRAFLTCEIPAPLPPWERAGRVAVRFATRRLLAGGGEADDVATILLGHVPIGHGSRSSHHQAVKTFLAEAAGRPSETAVNQMLREQFGVDAPIFAYSSQSRQAAVALLGTCESCGETPGPDQDEPIHQPWCPEVGGWWCNACQSWSASAKCDCGRPRAEAETWSPYATCPACGRVLDDNPQGTPETCPCGWEEGGWA